MNPSKYKKTAYLLITVLFLIGITFAAFFDLEISSALAGFSGENGSLSLSVPRYASFLEILGEWPAALIAGISFLLVTTVIAEKHKKQALGIRFFSVFPAACLFAYGCIKTAEYLNTDSYHRSHFHSDIRRRFVFPLKNSEESQRRFVFAGALYACRSRSDFHIRIGA